MKTMLKLWSHGDEVVEWQKIIGAEPDGKFGPITKRLTIAWQEQKGILADGNVGPQTWKAALSSSKVPEINVRKDSIAAVRGITELTDDDILAMVQAARAIGTEADYLAAVISFETDGTFSPSKQNGKGSGAVGLIQFMPKTAKGLATSSEALSKMTFQEQLKYVIAYFRSFERDFDTLRELYLAVFWPDAIDRKDDYVIAAKGTKVYEQNNGFDKAKKGFITRDDVCWTIDSVLAQSEKQTRIAIA